MSDLTTTTDPHAVGRARRMLADLETADVDTFVAARTVARPFSPDAWMVGYLTQTVRELLREYDRAVTR